VDVQYVYDTMTSAIFFSPNQDVNAKANCSLHLCNCHPLTSVSLLQAKLPPGANRILFVKNLNYQITGEDLYDLFGRYGSIRQIRIGNEPKTKGTAFVVFDDVMDVRSLFISTPSPPCRSTDSYDRLRMHWNI